MKKLSYLILVLASLCTFNVKIKAYNAYKVGDEIEYRGDKYYVIYDSGADEDYVTLLKATLLTTDELYKYGKDESDQLFINKYIYNSNNMEKVVFEEEGYGQIAFYTSETCSFEYKWNGSQIERTSNSIAIIDGCKNEYASSDVKKVLDNWSKNFQDDLVEVNDYKVRLLYSDELKFSFNIILKVVPSGIVGPNAYEYYTISSSTPDFIWKDIGSYWLMDKESIDKVAYFGYNNGYKIVQLNVSYPKGVRPVINLKKCALDKSCKTCNGHMETVTKSRNTFKSFKMGDEIEYKGNSYYVVSQNGNILNLLRKDPLSAEEISKYSDGAYTQDVVPYFTNNTCLSEQNNSGCSSLYSTSIVQQILNKWLKDNTDDEDLIVNDGYGVRILNIRDLKESLFYYYSSSTPHSGWFKTTNTPDWVSSSQCWVMMTDGDSDKEVFAQSQTGLSIEYVYNNRCIRPVIQLNVCALDGGCNEENLKIKVCVEDEISNIEPEKKDETKSALVFVDNTLKSFSYFLLIISVILIIGGIVILRKVYSKRN